MVNKNFKQPTPFLLFKDSQFISCKIPLSSGLVRDEREPLLYPLNNPGSQAGTHIKKFKNYASQIEFETLSICEPTGNNIQGPMINFVTMKIKIVTLCRHGVCQYISKF